MQPKKIRAALFVSGGGSNLQAILDACQNTLKNQMEVVWVISNCANAFGLERARRHNIEATFLDPKTYPSRPTYYEDIVRQLKTKQIDLICLAGFLLKLEPNIIQSYRNRILNIHPALLPKFGGKGMYGHFVHEAVLRAQETESGCTVHLVDEEFDRGETILQRKVPVLPNDTPATLAERVLKQEHLLYPQAIQLWIQRYASA